MSHFNTYITQYDYSWFFDLFVQNGALMQYRRNESFCFAGQPCKVLGFIKSGGFIYSAHNAEGSRYVTGYAFENSFVGDYAAFRLRESSSVDITALRDSEVYLLTNYTLNQLVAESTENRDQLLHVTEILYSEIYQRFITGYTLTPEEHYAEILHRCPDIFHHTTIKDLASYLQVTPETLSRIRRKLKER